MTHLRRRRGKNFFSKSQSRNGARKVRILYVKPYKTFNFSASGKIFEKWRLGIWVLELGLPCIGEPPYYLVQRKDRAKRGINFSYDGNTWPICAEGAERIFLKNSIPKRQKIVYVKLPLSLQNVQNFGLGRNFGKMMARNPDLEVGRRDSSTVWRPG